MDFHADSADQKMSQASSAYSRSADPFLHKGVFVRDICPPRVLCIEAEGRSKFVLVHADLIKLVLVQLHDCRVRSCLTPLLGLDTRLQTSCRCLQGRLVWWSGRHGQALQKFGSCWACLGPDLDSKWLE